MSGSGDNQDLFQLLLTPSKNELSPLFSSPPPYDDGQRGQNLQRDDDDRVSVVVVVGTKFARHVWSSSEG